MLFWLISCGLYPLSLPCVVEERTRELERRFYFIFEFFLRKLFFSFLPLLVLAVIKVTVMATAVVHDEKAIKRIRADDMKGMRSFEATLAPFYRVPPPPRQSKGRNTTSQVRSSASLIRLFRKMGRQKVFRFVISFIFFCNGKKHIVYEHT